MALDDIEHERLLRITEDLEREHQELRQRPGDLEAHAAHRDKLCQHIRALHSHIERLQKGQGRANKERAPLGAVYQRVEVRERQRARRAWSPTT